MHPDPIVFPHVYPPQEDTYLLLRHALGEIRPGDVALELGTGCGLIALRMAQVALEVCATDTNPHAVVNARLNAFYAAATNLRVEQGELYQPFQEQRFDLIVANPPYVPTPPDWEQTDIIEVSWNAGPDGRRIIDSILQELPHYLKPHGRFLMVQSSLADIPRTLKQLQSLGFNAQVIDTQWLSLGPVSQSRYNWLRTQETLINPENELLAVIRARQIWRDQNFPDV